MTCTFILILSSQRQNDEDPKTSKIQKLQKTLRRHSQILSGKKLAVAGQHETCLEELHENNKIQNFNKKK